MKHKWKYILLEHRRRFLILKDINLHDWHKRIVPFTSWINFLGILVWKTLNCYIIATVRAFYLNPTLRTRPKYQLSSGSLVLEDYTQQNWWDYTQQNRDCVALESFKSNLWVLIVKKVVLSNKKRQVFHQSMATQLSKNAGSPNLSLAPLRTKNIGLPNMSEFLLSWTMKI